MNSIIFQTSDRLKQVFTKQGKRFREHALKETDGKLLRNIESMFERESETTVVDVHVKSLRPKYQNLQEWCEDSNNVYIGRATRNVQGSFNSVWRNPFKTSEFSIETVLDKYERHIRQLLSDGQLDIETLRGKNLGCWCKPGPCHGDVLIKILNS